MAYDFGRVRQGIEVAHAFTFRNAGGLDLIIDNVRTGCGCTAALTSARTIPAQQQGSVAVAFDTAREFGRRTRTVTVYSNDPAQPVATLTLVGDVDAELAADPPELYLGHVRRAQTARNTVRLVAPRTAVGRLETSGRVIEAVVRDPLPGTTDRQLSITIRKDAPLGPFKEAVVVHPQAARLPGLTIPVSGVVDDGDASVRERRSKP